MLLVKDGPMYRLSIITINYNNIQGLKATLDSVAVQTFQGFEHIIVDGGSTDGAVNMIRDYVLSVEKNGSCVKWVSERDNGIYDAMNKGAAMASGDYLYFLNSGDVLASPAMMQEMMGLLDGSDCVIGRVNLTSRGQIVGQTNLLSEKDMSLYNMYLRGINHQSALIKRQLLIQTPYDTSIKIGADWKFFIQTIVLDGATTKFVDAIFANFDLSGLSSDTDTLRTERKAIIDTIVPKRLARDYLAIAPYYYEVIRVQWLLKHPFFYLIYRAWTSFGCKIVRRR